MQINKLPRDKDGKLPAYAWPGGYPIIYYTEDGGELCPDCANGKNNSEADPTHYDPQWKLIAGDVYWEGPPIQCAHCNKDIESAYGEVE